MVRGLVGPTSNFRSAIVDGAAVCFLTNVSDDGIYPNEEWTVKAKDESTVNDKRRISLRLTNFLTMGCMKINNKSFTLEEIQEAAKGIFEISVN